MNTNFNSCNHYLADSNWSDYLMRKIYILHLTIIVTYDLGQPLVMRYFIKINYTNRAVASFAGVTRGMKRGRAQEGVHKYFVFF